MNLSKIATGIVASFCLVSNVAISADRELVIDESTARVSTVPVHKEKELSYLNETNMPFLDGSPIIKNEQKILNRETYEALEKDSLFQKVYGKALENLNNLENESDLNNIINLRKRTLDYIGLFEELIELKYYGNEKAFLLYEMMNDEANDNINAIRLNKNSISKNNRGIEQNSRAIHENRGRIDINTKSIMENRGIITESSKKISDNRELIGKNIQDIYKNKEMMMGIADKNAKAISANSKMIEEMRSSFNTRLNHLKRDLKRGLATQSALNGLFQPYSVGKFNLTAAFGGYQSQTAIAIGTGYRFNERIAAKAGIAKSVKGAALSYNVGVNYEF